MRPMYTMILTMLDTYTNRHLHVDVQSLLHFIPCLEKYSQSEYKEAVVYTIVLHPLPPSCVELATAL